MRSPAICYLNGRYVALGRACVPADDRGLLYGEGLFETWRTYRGRPFALREHLDRLARAAHRLGIPFAPDESWERRTRELARRNRLSTTSAVFRLTLTGGTGPFGLVAPEVRKPTRLLLVRPLEQGLGAARERGVAVHLYDAGAGVEAAVRSLKSINYLAAVLARTQAARRGCFEALYRLEDDTILEGTTTNVFLIESGKLVTPPVAAGLLPGVTRAIVLRLARRALRVAEERIDVARLWAADEAFLTSTSIEIVPIVRAGRRRIGDGRPGPYTRELQRRYRAFVAERVGLDAAALGE